MFTFLPLMLNKWLFCTGES